MTDEVIANQSYKGKRGKQYFSQYTTILDALLGKLHNNSAFWEFWAWFKSTSEC